ncbi:putative protein OS=Streptomyces glaucescens OX=1907 GN=SGLAU_05845 PE=4 SV=1 [Streptomyces glaucescens]
MRCAEGYLSAVEAAAVGGGRRSAGARCSPAAAIPAYVRCSSRSAGIKAHVGHDLVLAVVDACRTLGSLRSGRSLEGEFDRVGDLLVLLEERIRDGS